MSFLDKLERKLGGFAIPHLTEILILGQVLVWIATSAGWMDMDNILLVPDLVANGEYRRLVTFLFIPPSEHFLFLKHPIFLVFAWAFFYFMAGALENHWGEFRYNLFIFVGYAAAVAVSFLDPYRPATNAFIGTSVFLAFALLYPDFLIYLFFILPVKVKWVAAITWIFYGYGLLFGGTGSRIHILASVANLALFFGKELILRIRQGGRAMASQTREIAAAMEPLHRCHVCGITNLTHPEMDFRYCSRCGGQKGYCAEHLRSHTHG